MIEEKLQSDINTKLIDFDIEEYNIIDSDPEIWIQILCLEEENFDYVLKSINCLDNLTLTHLKDYDCKIKISSDISGIYYIMGKFKKKYLYNPQTYNSGTYKYPNYPSYKPSYEKKPYYELEEEEGDDLYPSWDDLKKVNSKFLINRDYKNEILAHNSYKPIPFIKNELDHITRIIEDRIPSEIIDSFQGPYKTGSGDNCYLWTTPDRTMTLYKNSCKVDNQTRKLKEDAYNTTFYILKMQPKNMKDELWFLFMNIGELRKFKF